MFRLRLLYQIIFSALIICINTVPALSQQSQKYMRLIDERGKPVMFFNGGIDSGDFRQFSAFMNQNPNINEIWLNSGGGDVDEALQIGMFIRDRVRPVKTRVPARQKVAAAFQKRGIPISRKLRDTRSILCASACGILLAAGDARYVDEPFTVGLHGVALSFTVNGKEIHRDKYVDQLSESELRDALKTAYDEGSSDRSRNGAKVAEFMVTMGVSAQYAIYMNGIRAECLAFLSYDQMLRFNVTNVKGVRRGDNKREPEWVSNTNDRSLTPNANNCLI